LPATGDKTAPAAVDGQKTAAPAEPSGPAAPAVTVSGSRKGQALYVRVVARAQGREARSEIERADYWHVEAASSGRVLDKLVNGSTKVMREEARGRGKWDVTVTFDAAFRLPGDATQSEVWVAAPGDDFRRFVIAGL